MNKDNRPLLTNEPVEFEKYPVQDQDFSMITIILEESKEYTNVGLVVLFYDTSGFWYAMTLELTIRPCQGTRGS